MPSRMPSPSPGPLCSYWMVHRDGSSSIYMPKLADDPAKRNQMYELIFPNAAAAKAALAGLGSVLHAAVLAQNREGKTGKALALYNTRVSVAWGTTPVAP